MPNSFIHFLQEPRKAGSRLSREVESSDTACSEGVHTWVNTEAIHFVKKYQNNHLACYKSVSRLQGKWEVP